jgi:hypothetical protein
MHNEDAEDLRSRIKQLEDALVKFARAANYADAQLKSSNLTEPMDRRDFFIWQASRRLCVADFNVAVNALAGE